MALKLQVKRELVHYMSSSKMCFDHLGRKESLRPRKRDPENYPSPIGTVDGDERPQGGRSVLSKKDTFHGNGAKGTPCKTAQRPRFSVLA